MGAPHSTVGLRYVARRHLAKVEDVEAMPLSSARVVGSAPEVLHRVINATGNVHEDLLVAPRVHAACHRLTEYQMKLLSRSIAVPHNRNARHRCAIGIFLGQIPIRQTGVDCVVELPVGLVGLDSAMRSTRSFWRVSQHDRGSELACVVSVCREAVYTKVCTTYCTIDAELVPIGQPIESGGEDETALFEHDLANEIICHAPFGHLPNVGSTAAWQAVTTICDEHTQVVRPHHRVVEEQ